MNGVIEHEGWLLTPEGAAIRPEEATIVVADVHLGYEWARGEAGDSVPVHSLRRTRARLEKALGRFDARRLVVAGDLVESSRPCTQTAADVARLEDWLASRGVEMVVVEGNHDRGLFGSPRPPAMVATLDVAGWTIQHGDRAVTGGRAVIGHHHPVLRAGGLVAPCFLAGPTLLALPAFSTNAAGLNATAANWPREDLRCLAATNDGLLDFGPVATLAARLRAIVPPH